MRQRSFYATWQWRRLARLVKERDGRQCQVCGDRRGDPYCVLNAHHIIPRSRRGPDKPKNLITLCDLCHAVVTPRWHKPWFGKAATERKEELEAARQEFVEFLSLDPRARAHRQALLWQALGVAKVCTAAEALCIVVRKRTGGRMVFNAGADHRQRDPVRRPQS